MNNLKLHLGCGHRNFGKDWIHIDSGDYNHLDYKSITDLSQFKDNSVGLIYSSHVVGYFDRKEVIPLLLEWKRVLHPAAILRIAVPDFEKIAHLYSSGAYALSSFLGPLYGKMLMGPEQIYHKTVYDFDSLKVVLEKVGFHSVKRYNWFETSHASCDDQSQAYLPHMDKQNGTLISLNVEALR